MSYSKKSLILNPFQRIAGGKALLWGLAGIVLTVLFCAVTQVCFDGFLHVGLATENVCFFTLLLQQLVMLLLTVILFYLAGVILSKSKVRFIDVLGTFAFARLPLLLLPLLGFSATFKKTMTAEFAMKIMQNPEMVYSSDFMIITLIGILILPLVVWHIIWLFQAYKTSCNLNGVKLWLPFIILWLAASFVYDTFLAKLLVF